MFLSEEITRRRAIGIVFGLAGLAVIFNPQTLNWSDSQALFGSGLMKKDAETLPKWRFVTQVLPRIFKGTHVELPEVHVMRARSVPSYIGSVSSSGSRTPQRSSSAALSLATSSFRSAMRAAAIDERRWLPSAG